MCPDDFSNNGQDDFSFSRRGSFFSWFSQYKIMQITRYIFGYQINNLYICINKNATGQLTPCGKKKKK